ncbi:MAG TPA: hypothetical protein VGX22_04985 [Candidatus Dormibacteraeota bacterium]|nr:hypothetical protein [Candidatus Dormibacteraeota bacterium]
MGGGAAAACVLGGIVCVGIDAPRSFLLVYLIGLLLALLGALVVAREPRNTIGWLMVAYAWLVSLMQTIPAYGYAAVGVHHGSWPLGSLAALIGTWIWVPSVGFLALIAVRFPDGQGRRFGRVVDWIYLSGSALFALAIAVEPPAVALQFSAFPSLLLDKMLPYFQDPIPFHLGAQVLAAAQGAGITLILVGSIVAAASLILRYRQAHGDERLQIKWFAYSAGLCAAAVAYGGVAWDVFGQPLYLAMTPLEFAGLTLPAAIGIAILRYRLYDIDLIINRTLVYGGLTAILGALYAAVVTLLNRFFISVSGQRSDAAYVVTAFVVVIAASPVKDWLQHQVDRRVRHGSPSAMLDRFRSDVDAVVSVIDVHRVARRLLDQAIEAFDARGAAVYLDSNDESKPLYSRGYVNGEIEVDVALRYDGTQYGRLVLARRRGDIEYTAHDRAVLQQSADSVGEALALAAHLGFKPLARSH